VIKDHLNKLGFTIYLGPSFENRKAGSTVNLGAEQLFTLVESTFKANPTTEAIYFQGATLDPLPILQHLEDTLGVPVVTSNTAMIWRLLSMLKLNFSVKDRGLLLAKWPQP
jgi:maleate cis-trans isomerase